jgi:hypothetical protein
MVSMMDRIRIVVMPTWPMVAVSAATMAAASVTPAVSAATMSTAGWAIGLISMVLNG